MRPRLDSLEWGCLAFGLVVAHAFLAHEWLHPSHYDAYTYQVMGDQIAQQGLFSKWVHSDLRTYGYPFFLSLVRRASSLIQLDFRVLLFALQLGLFLGAAFFLRGALARLWPAAARLAFCGLLVNFYVLIFPSASLTESLTLALTIFAAGCWVRLHAGDARLWPLLAGSLGVGFAMMVRPANVFLAAAWAFALALTVLRRRPLGPRALLAGACVAVAMALPMLPQLANNVRHYGTGTPLVAAPLGSSAQYWGIRNMKYATAMAPVPKPEVEYVNPLVAGTQVDPAAPMRWYLENPVRGLATIALHTFNMLDQDLLFTYSRDLDPWYRLPLGIVNHAVLALALIGLALLARNLWKGPAPARDALLALAVLLAANWAVYATSMVEMRFGSVILLAAFPLAGYALQRAWAHRGDRRIDLAGAAIVAYVVLALGISGWVREHSPAIRQATRQAAAPLPPSASLAAVDRERLQSDAQLARIGVEAELGGRGRARDRDLDG